MFVDEHQLRVKAGKGGNGCVSFRREAGAPKGGPDGGDGGNGGNVVFRASQHLNGLHHLQHIREIKSENGIQGKGAKLHGRNGNDKVIEVPVGTIISEIVTISAPEPEPEIDPENTPEEAFSEEGASGEDYEEPEGETEIRQVADLDEPDKQVVVARGGKGGWGNKRFASATNQTPREAKPGREGEIKSLKLEVKLIADVGLVGLPNAGKSTLLSHVTRANPKVAAYPFTTLNPHLGIVQLDAENRFIMADIPGLIEGAADGKGLGHQFLRHVERTRVLLHLIDLSTDDVETLKQQHDIIVGELEGFSPELAAKPRILVGNKADIPGTEEKAAELGKLLGQELKLISGVTGQGLKPLLWELHNLIQQQ
ncbi:MAG: GTPase ObgE [Planctomycetota bacterium]